MDRIQSFGGKGTIKRKKTEGRGLSSSSITPACPQKCVLCVVCQRRLATKHGKSHWAKARQARSHLCSSRANAAHPHTVRLLAPAAVVHIQHNSIVLPPEHLSSLARVLLHVHRNRLGSIVTAQNELFRSIVDLLSK